MKRTDRYEQAFTLLELLVVITIISILAAVLFPVFVQAKQAAKKANCVSNLKQISLAWVLYATDYDDVMCVTQYWEADYNEPDYISYPSKWWSHADSGYPDYAVSMEDGLLQPYMKNIPILDCPSAVGVPTNSFSPVIVAYGINSRISEANIDYGTGQEFGTSFSMVDQPAETILMGDAASYHPFADYFRTVLLSPPISPYFALNKLQGRHSGQATIAWLDGHSKTHRIDYPNQGIYIDDHKQYVLGDILKYARENTDRDAYFYVLDKAEAH